MYYYEYEMQVCKYTSSWQVIKWK